MTKRTGQANTASKPKQATNKPVNVTPETKPDRDPELQVAYERGRHARVGGIRCEDTPYLGEEAKAWREGWDYEDEALKA